MRAALAPAVAAALLGLPASAPAQAPGSLDPSFGDGGRVSVRVGGGSTPETVVKAPDGRLVVGGSALDAAALDAFALARFSADGQLDRTFAQNGALVEQLGTGEATYSRVKALVAEPDGDIIAVGHARAPDGVRLAALKVDAAGRVVWRTTHQLADNTNGSWATHAARRPDGRIVVAGVAARGTVRYAMVAQLDPEDGSLDPSFGGTGYVLERGAPEGDVRDGGDAVPRALVLRPSGGVVMAGNVDNSCGHNQCYTPFLQAYDAGGRQEEAFGAGPLGYGRITDLIPAADGSFTAFGTRPTDLPADPLRWALARFTAAGELDRSFAPPEGLDEVGRPANRDASFIGLAQQPDGRLLSTTDAAITRLLPDGRVDESFGYAGLAATGLDSAVPPLLQPDGRIVAAGQPAAPEDLRNCPGYSDCSQVRQTKEFMLVRLMGGTAAGRVSVERSGRLRGRVARLTLACTATGATDCAGVVKLTSVRTRRRPRRVALGRARYSLPAGTTTRVEVRLSRAAARRIRRAGRRPTVRVRMSNGAAPVAQRRVALVRR